MEENEELKNKPLHLQLINFLTREPRQFKGEKQALQEMVQKQLDNM